LQRDKKLCESKKHIPVRPTKPIDEEESSWSKQIVYKKENRGFHGEEAARQENRGFQGGTIIIASSIVEEKESLMLSHFMDNVSALLSSKNCMKKVAKKKDG
jgi:hypothetical protein